VNIFDLLLEDRSGRTPGSRLGDRPCADTFVPDGTITFEGQKEIRGLGGIVRGAKYLVLVLLQVVIISDRVWRQQLGGNSKVVGRQGTLTIDSRPRVAIGIMPRSFRFLDRDPELSCRSA
jgi:hypothetical protein